MHNAFIVLVFGVLATGSPVPEEINWPEVGKKAQEFRDIVKDGLKFLIDESKRGDAAVGTELETFLEAKRPQLVVNMEKVKDEIADHSLTPEKADTYLKNAKTNWEKTVEEMKPILAKLPEANTANIRGQFEKTHEALAKIAKEIHDLVNGGPHDESTH